MSEIFTFRDQSQTGDTTDYGQHELAGYGGTVLTATYDAAESRMQETGDREQFSGLYK